MKNRILFLTVSILILATLISIAFIRTASSQEKTLVVTSYGGKYEQVLKMDTPIFEKKYNVKVTYVPASGEDTLIRSRNREVDVIHADPIYGFRGEAEGLFAELDEKSIPNLKDIYGIAKIGKTQVATNFGVYGIAYNPKFVKTVPTSWNDLWKPEYKGKVTMRSFRPESMSLLVLMAKLNKGNEQNIDPGYKKMSELAPNMNAWYKEHAEALSMLKQEQVWLAVWTNGRAAWAKQEGANVEFVVPKEGGFALVSTVHVVKARPNVDLAKKYVDFLCSEAPQVTMAKELQYGPTNKKAKVDAALVKATGMPYGEKEVSQLWMPDWKYMITVWDKWSERWQKEVIK